MLQPTVQALRYLRRSCGSYDVRTMEKLLRKKRRVSSMRLDVLASGSEANCCIVSSGSTSIMVDAGLPAAEAFRRSLKVGVDIERIVGVAISHGHQDHFRGAEGIANRLGIPIFCSEPTALAMKWGRKPQLRIFDYKTHCFPIGEVSVWPVPVPHDALGAVCYGFSHADEGCVIATDLGSIQPDLAALLSNAETILLEANYSKAMLGASPDPQTLRERVGGEMGHLSNEAVCSWIRSGMTKVTKRLVIGHISRRNNDYSLCRLMVESALDDAGLSPVLEVIAG